MFLGGVLHILSRTFRRDATCRRWQWHACSIDICVLTSIEQLCVAAVAVRKKIELALLEPVRMLVARRKIRRRYGRYFTQYAQRIPCCPPSRAVCAPSGSMVVAYTRGIICGSIESQHVATKHTSPRFIPAADARINSSVATIAQRFHVQRFQQLSIQFPRQFPIYGTLHFATDQFENPTDVIWLHVTTHVCSM